MGILKYDSLRIVINNLITSYRIKTKRQFTSRVCKSNSTFFRFILSHNDALSF